MPIQSPLGLGSHSGTDESFAHDYTMDNATLPIHRPFGVGSHSGSDKSFAHDHTMDTTTLPTHSPLGVSSHIAAAPVPIDMDIHDAAAPLASFHAPVLINSPGSGVGSPLADDKSFANDRILDSATPPILSPLVVGCHNVPDVAFPTHCLSGVGSHSGSDRSFADDRTMDVATLPSHFPSGVGSFQVPAAALHTLSPLGVGSHTAVAPLPFDMDVSATPCTLDDCSIVPQSAVSLA